MNQRLISTGTVLLILINGLLGEIIPNYGVMDNLELLDGCEITINEASANFPGFGNYFTENKGQMDNENVLFYLHGSVAFTKDSVIFNTREPKTMSTKDSSDFNNLNRESNTNVRGEVFLVRFENSNDVVPIGINNLPYRSNYFLDNDSTKWRTNIANYESIIYPNIYNGIDLIYRIKDGFLKYDFMVYPDANPGEICLKYEGIEKLTSKLPARKRTGVIPS